MHDCHMLYSAMTVLLLSLGPGGLVSDDKEDPVEVKVYMYTNHNWH